MNWTCLPFDLPRPSLPLSYLVAYFAPEVEPEPTSTPRSFPPEILKTISYYYTRKKDSQTETDTTMKTERDTVREKQTARREKRSCREAERVRENERYNSKDWEKIEGVYLGSNSWGGQL